MSGNASVSVTGLDELVQLVHRLRPPTEAEAQAILLRAVEPARAAAERKAPRAPRPTHGPKHGAEAIVAEPLSTAEGAHGTATVGVGTTAAGWWLRFAETGTSKLTARPWLRPSVDETMGQFEKLVADGLRPFAEAIG